MADDRQRIDVPDELHEFVMDQYGPTSNSKTAAYNQALADLKRRVELEQKRAESGSG